MISILNRKINNLVKEKKEAKELSDELEKFQLAIEHASDLVIIMDSNGNVTYANKAAEIITGYKKKEMLGKKPMWWSTDEGSKSYQKIWDVINNKKKNYSGELINKRKNGKNYVASVHIYPIFDKKREVKFFVDIARDISDYKEIDKTKNEFVSFASHQLRTPLSTVNWYVEILLLEDVGKINKVQKKYLKKIYEGNERLIKLVNNLLNVQRLDLDAFANYPELTNIIKIVENSIKKFSCKIKEKKLSIEKKYNKNLSLVKIDPKFISIITENLIENSIKYTPEYGKIKIDIEFKNSRVLLTVEDTGFGIPIKDKDKIFTKLFRSDNIREEDPYSTGLGLYVVKKIVKKMKGNIWFKTKENKGTTFYVKIPIEK